jgi:hypothetical protein
MFSTGAFLPSAARNGSESSAKTERVELSRWPIAANDSLQAPKRMRAIEFRADYFTARRGALEK